MAINKRARNIYINVKNNHTTICGGEYKVIAESITITSTKEDLVLASNKKVIVEGKEGGIVFGNYTPLTPNIISIIWMDEREEKQINRADINQPVFLYVETEDKKGGTDISISVTTSDNSEVVLNGTTAEDGIARIPWVYV